MSKVFDCCMVFNELDMLDLRFHILNPVVDYFVVVESGMTHSGQPKARIFGDALEQGRFAEFEDKIVYHYAETLEGDHSWTRERYQRSLIGDVVGDVANPDDWVMVVDADEIPNPDGVKILKERRVDRPVMFEMGLYYYDFHHQVAMGWGIGACHWGQEQDANKIRSGQFDAPTGVNTCHIQGWHCSYFMKPEEIAVKLDAFMHHGDVAKDVPRDPVWLKAKMDAGQDIYGRDLTIEHVPLSDSLPRYVLDHLDKYRALGWVEPVQEVTQ